jgi:hypothetical protein
MSRVSQKRASRGSQKWIQMLVNQAPQLLDRAVARHLNLSPTDRIVWLSPLAEDAYAEYRDEMFLSKIDARAEVAPLSGFWPTRVRNGTRSGERAAVSYCSSRPRLIFRSSCLLRRRRPDGRCGRFVRALTG